MSLDVDLFMDVDCGGDCTERIYLFESNITHNLGSMAKEAGIYYHLWRPEEIGAKQAKDISESVENGLALMKAEPDRFKEFNSPNGWGMYEHFIPWIEEYLEAMKRYPNAKISVSR